MRANVEIVQTLVDGLPRGDADAARAACDPGLEWHAAADELEAGKHATIEETHVYRLRGGRVVEVRVYRTRAAAIEAVGLEE